MLSLRHSSAWQDNEMAALMKRFGGHSDHFDLERLVDSSAQIGVSEEETGIPFSKKKKKKKHRHLSTRFTLAEADEETNAPRNRVMFQGIDEMD